MPPILIIGPGELSVIGGVVAAVWGSRKVLTKYRDDDSETGTEDDNWLWRFARGRLQSVFADPERHSDGFTPSESPPEPDLTKEEALSLRHLARQHRRWLAVLAAVLPPLAYVRADQYRLAILAAVTMPVANLVAPVHLSRTVSKARRQLYAANIKW